LNFRLGFACWRNKLPFQLITHGFEKGDQLLLFGSSQAPESPLDVSCFAAVTEDRIFHRQRCKVMHETSLHPKPPERRRSKLRRSVLWTRLNDPIAGPHIVQEEIAERVDDFV
jgi:hypothetical protein